MLANIFLVVHLVIAVAIVVLVLLQQGKGADMGAAFGGGSSQTLFGARGSSNFLSRLTAGLVAGFFLTSLTLAYVYNQRSGTSQSIIQGSAPAAPASEIVEEPADTLPPVPQEAPVVEGGSEVPVAPPVDGAAAGNDIPSPPE